MWILKQEEARRNGRIFISKHNGHVKKSGNYDANNNKVMGNLLADEIGNKYFVIVQIFIKLHVICRLMKTASEKIIFFTHMIRSKIRKRLTSYHLVTII